MPFTPHLLMLLLYPGCSLYIKTQGTVDFVVELAMEVGKALRLRDVKMRILSIDHPDFASVVRP
jgi:hypothetical protein